MHQYVFLNPDSAVKPNLARGRRNPGAAKASDCEVAKSFCALARRCYEALHPLRALSIDVSSEAKPHRLCCGRILSRAFCRSQLRNSSLNQDSAASAAGTGAFYLSMFAKGKVCFMVMPFG